MRSHVRPHRKRNRVRHAASATRNGTVPTDGDFSLGDPGLRSTEAGRTAPTRSCKGEAHAGSKRIHRRRRQEGRPVPLRWQAPRTATVRPSLPAKRRLAIGLRERGRLHSASPLHGSGGYERSRGRSGDPRMLGPRARRDPDRAQVHPPVPVGTGRVTERLRPRDSRPATQFWPRNKCSARCKNSAGKPRRSRARRRNSA